MYLVAERALGRPYTKTLSLLPLMICFGCGLAVNNTRAVLEALIGRSSAFVRTPKSGARERKRYAVAQSPLVLLELAVGLWCLFGMILYFASQHYLIGHFMLIYAVGFLGIGLFSWRHANERARA